MLNGPTYPYLVKYFWVREEVFDESVAHEELRLIVNRDNSLKGKTRKKAVLKEFEEIEIRLTKMRVDVVINQKTIVKLLRAPNTCRYLSEPKTIVLKLMQSNNICFYSTEHKSWMLHKNNSYIVKTNY